MSVSNNPPQGTGRKLKSVSSGLTASVTQTQGQVPLTSDLNQFSIVANDGDATTLPKAIVGKEITIINDGLNTLQIFPVLDDDLGNGPNISVELEINESVEFISFSNTTWKIEASSEIFHAEMHDQDNATPFVINAQDEVHGYTIPSMVAGDIAGWTFKAGKVAAIDAIADATGGDIRITTDVAHGRIAGDIVTQTNLADPNYVGVFTITNVTDATHYDVTAVFTATGTGSMNAPDALICSAIAAGQYDLDWSLSLTPATSNSIFEFELCKNDLFIIGTKRNSKFGAGGDFRTPAGGGIIDFAADDKLSIVLDPKSNSGNCTIKNIGIKAKRL